MRRQRTEQRGRWSTATAVMAAAFLMASQALADAPAAEARAPSPKVAKPPEQPTWFDARATLQVQAFQQALLPGVPGMMAPIDLALPITATGFLRFGGIDALGVADSLSGEVALWGRLGPRDGLVGDGDLTTAWAQYKSGPWRVKVGRQVTWPGSARYVRFDGVSGGVTSGFLDADAYAGFVALPRWSLPRGAWVLGSIGDALEDPRLREAQNRAGQFLLGVRVGARAGALARGSLAFHEQHDAVGVAYRVLSADVTSQPVDWLGVGGRASFDVKSLGFSEARVWADMTGWRVATASVDYVYQSPALLLPQTSVLAAFGGASWHELGAELAVQLPWRLSVTGRAAGQLYDGDRPGGRGLGRVKWQPDLDGRWLVQAEVARVLMGAQGYTQVRASGRWRATSTVAATLDSALYLYDAPIAGTRHSLTGIASAEWAVRPWLKTLLSTTVMQTPFAAFELQGLARVVVELEPSTTGGRP